MTADPPLASPGMVYATYGFYLLIKYRYRIDIVSNSKNKYRCITKLVYPVTCALPAAAQSLLPLPIITAQLPLTGRYIIPVLEFRYDFSFYTVHFMPILVRRTIIIIIIIITIVY